MKSKIFSIIVLILLSISSVYAADPKTTWDKDRPSEFDYSNANADISSVPPGNLDLDKVDKNNRYGDLTEDQIAHHLPNIKDLSKLDEHRLNYAIRRQEWGKDKTLIVKDCISCTISNDGTFKNGAGAVIYLKDYPTGTTFIAKLDGSVELVVPDGSSINMPKIVQQQTGPDFDETAYVHNSITIKGNNIEFLDGSKLNSGSLTIVGDDRLILDKGSFTTSENAIVKSYTSSTTIIFGEITSPEPIMDPNYAQFDRKNRRALVHGESVFSVQFGEINPYINIRSDAENFEVIPANKGTVVLEQAGNKAPTIIITGPSIKTHWGTITNGQYLVYLGKFGVMDIQYSFINNNDPTPAEIFVIGDNKLSAINKDLNQYKLVFNDAGEFRIVDYDIEVNQDGTFTCPKQKCEIPLQYYMHAGARQDIKRKYKIEVIGGTEDDLKKIKENLDRTPPDILGKIKRISIAAGASEIQDTNPGAAATPAGTIYVISDDLHSFSDYVFAHENSHISTFSMIQKDHRQEVSNLKDILTRGQISNEDFDLQLAKLNRDYTKSKEPKFGHTAASFSPFVQEWTKAAGDVYGKTTEVVIVEGESKLVWVDKDDKFSEAPRHGCVRPYGCTTFFEDVATYVEAFNSDKGSFEVKNNLNKDKRMQQKVYLLWKYKFITDDQYKKLGSPQPSP